MGNAAINRFEWLKAVTQADNLLPAAKVIATALSVQFANDETGQLNPTVPTLADYVKASVATVKRAIKALVEAGWLGKTEGRGRGNSTSYTLCSPGKIISFSTQRKGGTSAPLTKEKGAPVRGKGGTGAPFQYKDKQSLEQRAGAAKQFASHRFEGNACDGVQMLSKKNHWPALNAWADWLKAEGLPELCRIPISELSGKDTVFFLPYRKPPDSEAKNDEARRYFYAVLETERVCYAAQ